MFLGMASPAPTPSSGLIDPHRKSQYSLQISDALLAGDTNESMYSSVRLNHKPKFISGSRTIQLQQAGSTAATLDIKDRDQDETRSYHYEGTKSSPKKSYVLVFDPETQSATLQPLTASYSLNLKSNPRDSFPSQSAEQYPQISEENDESVDGDSSDPHGSISDGEPEHDNPFDFRHFLDGAKQPRSPVSPAPASTSKLAAPDESDAAISRAAFSIQSKKLQKTTQQEPPPKIRVERKASTRSDDPVSGTSTKAVQPVSRLKKGKAVPRPRPDVTSVPKSQDAATSHEFDLLADDDEEEDNEIGGLEIDFGDEGPPRSRARALTLPASSRDGPISLRSAANSPSSQINTPRRRLQNVDEFVFESAGIEHDHEDEDADVSDEDEGSPQMSRTSRIVREIVESDGDDDVDVEPISLGSPIHGRAEDSSEEVDHNVGLAEGVWAGLAESGYISPAPDSESESEAE